MILWRSTEGEGTAHIHDLHHPQIDELNINLLSINAVAVGKSLGMYSLVARVVSKSATQRSSSPPYPLLRYWSKIPIDWRAFLSSTLKP